MRSKNDRNKLLEAGFTILRIDDYPSIVLKNFTDKGNWSIWKVFKNKAERNKEIERINKHQNKIIFE